MKKKIVLVIIVCSVIFLIFKVIQKRRSGKSLGSNYIMQSGIVDSCWIQFKSSTCYVYYSFEYEGKRMKGQQELYGVECSKHQDKFINRSFALAVDKTNPANNAILITPNHFKKIGIEFPDSLNWILKYYDDNFVSF